MTYKKMKQILKLHEKWLNGEEGGKLAIIQNDDLSNFDLAEVNLRRAIFRNVDLSHANLHRANLTGANLTGINLTEANLVKANLSEATLDSAILKKANLYFANLFCASLEETVLTEANLSNAILTQTYSYKANLQKAKLYRAFLCETNFLEADLTYANICGADLHDTQLYKAKLDNIIYDGNTKGFFLVCPEKGSYIGYKVARDYIVELLIPEDAKRSSATTRKCRASKAKVLSITTINGSPADIQSVPSDHDENFIYTIGKTVEVKNFCEDRWRECAPGIHHFITRQEAVFYR